MNDQVIEQEIQAKGKTAARITPDDLQANIVSEHYFTAADGRRGAIDNDTYVGREKPQEGNNDLKPLELLTFCVLVLRNGFTVTGESACASPENFDAEIGRKIARQNAEQKVWPLMGYELRSKLAAAPQPAAQAQEDAVAQAVAAEREACAQVCESWADEHDYAGAIRARGTDAAKPAAQAQEDVPDMFWDADDTENFAHEIQDIIDGYGPGEIVTIECAKRLPNFRVVVTRDGDGISYEYLEAAIAAQPAAQAQLDAVGAGGVGPLRKRCLHQISESQAQPVAWAIFAENGLCRMWTQNKGHADVAAKDTGLPLTALYATPQPVAQTQDALVIAEAALADIGDADHEPNDDLAWCEARAAQALPMVRAAIAAQQGDKP